MFACTIKNKPSACLGTFSAIGRRRPPSAAWQGTPPLNRAKLSKLFFSPTCPVPHKTTSGHATLKKRKHKIIYTLTLTVTSFGRINTRLTLASSKRQRVVLLLRNAANRCAPSSSSSSSPAEDRKSCQDYSHHKHRHKTYHSRRRRRRHALRGCPRVALFRRRRQLLDHAHAAVLCGRHGQERRHRGAPAARHTRGRRTVDADGGRLRHRAQLQVFHL